MNIFLTVLLTVFLFGVLIFIHELGHFTTAKLFKVRVNEFSLGMGPSLFKFGKGETEYHLRALPIGGYVSMEGEEEDSDDPRSFKKQKVWKRIIISLAGVFMNFVLGLVIAIILVASSEGKYLESTVVSKSNIQGTETGLQKDDRIISVSGYRVFSGKDITFGISRTDPMGKTKLSDVEAEFVVMRDGEKITLKGIHPYTKIKADDGKEYDSFSFYVYPEKKNFVNVIKGGFFEALSYVRITVLGLSDLITGKVGLEGVGGVVKVGEMVGEVSQYGVRNFLMLMALISVNLGVMNLLPIPALDGGRVVLLIYEGIFRKPINTKVEYALIAVSMILLFALMILVTIKDIISII